MSGNQPYRERERGGGGDRGEPMYNRSRGAGGFRGGRGGGPGGKPRRYWDNDEYYNEERGHGRRRRRSYSRSRSRSYSRSPSRSPQRRGRSRSPPPRGADPSHRGPQEPARIAAEPEPYVPRDPSSSWSESRMQIPQEYAPQSNGQAPRAASQMNMYTTAEATAYPQHYQDNQHGMASMGNPTAIPYGYGFTQYPPPHAPTQMYPPHSGIVQPVAPVAPPPPSLAETKPVKDDGNIEGSKKKKDKRKKKKRKNSSSSSSSSSEESSGSRRRRKSKKDGSSDSSSEEDKKEKSGLTSAQKEALCKQRESYQTKLEILEREISKLKGKEEDLVRSRADRQLIDENLALQAELKGRCKAVVIVLEKIDDVLQVNKSKSSKVAPQEKSKPEPAQELYVKQPLKGTMAVSDSIQPADQAHRNGSFDYFDNGQHWCRLCNVFPETLELLLKHFHSKEHHDQIQQLGIDEKPWHKRNSVTESKSVSGARKAPFRGMQFFSPVEGWYCRLCNSWMGDPHCAMEHLKSDDHNSNYMNFLEEQPGWEQKWITDREKALAASGKKDPGFAGKKSRFDEPRFGIEVPERIPSLPQSEDMESGKSIRVQMRNVMKNEERSGVPPQVNAGAASDPQKDASSMDEWMNKPKVTVDIIDTQKFAAIVRQKHGSKDKDPRDDKSDVPDVKMVPPPAPVPPPKEKEYKKEREDRRRPDKVEMQISSRDRERDRHRDTRDRDARSSRRRSRSRSRSRDRRYNRRRSRSRSRSRDRSDRDRRDRDRDRPEIKEAVKKLPMIGKMPLYKRPALNSREKQDADKGKSAEVSPKPPASDTDKTDEISKNETVKAAEYNETPMDVSATYGAYDPHAAYDQSMAHYGVATSYSQITTDMYIQHDVPKSYTAAVTDDVPGEEPKESKEDGPAALPDDFQQALDIIYAPPGAPQPVPPPAANGMEEAMGVDPSEYDYANGYGYMGYQPYQQSFDGYAPVGYDDLDDGPPGVGDSKPAAASDADKSAEEEPAPPGDDMEDLRMLGIDVEDTAVVVKN